MSLEELLAAGRLKRRKTTAKEISSLFAVVERDLLDAQVPGLSLDRRFATAYNAALQAGRACLASEGYRTTGQGHHASAFQALRAILEERHHHVLDYLDDCRSKRNLAEYTGTEVASENEVADLMTQARGFADLVRGRIRKRHPSLLQPAR